LKTGLALRGSLGRHCFVWDENQLILFDYSLESCVAKALEYLYRIMPGMDKLAQIPFYQDY
jgi:hypothetical protein